MRTQQLALYVIVISPHYSQLQCQPTTMLHAVKLLIQL